MRIEFGKRRILIKNSFFVIVLIILSITFEVIMLPLYKQIFLYIVLYRYSFCLSVFRDILLKV